jgi:hypothetical protein
MTVFLALSGLSYVYMTLQIYKNDTAIRVKKAELVVLQQANASLGDALTLLHTLREALQKSKGDKKD